MVGSCHPWNKHYRDSRRRGKLQVHRMLFPQQSSFYFAHDCMEGTAGASSRTHSYHSSEFEVDELPSDMVFLAFPLFLIG